MVLLTYEAVIGFVWLIGFVLVLFGFKFGFSLSLCFIFCLSVGVNRSWVWEMDGQKERNKVIEAVVSESYSDRSSGPSHCSLFASIDGTGNSSESSVMRALTWGKERCEGV